MTGLSTTQRRALALVATLYASCEYAAPSKELASPSALEFQELAYPVLLRDCGFPACHGTHDRFFQVFGPGRARLSAETEPMAAATKDELSLSYTRAASMLGARSLLRDSLLLRKPLARAAGGAHHEGEDPWGHNVYDERSADGYEILAAWARSRADNGEQAP